MRPTIRTKTAMAATVFASFFTLGVESLRAETCSIASYRGDYAFTETGAVINLPPVPAGPLAIVGKFTADGQGNVIGAQTRSSNGVIFRETYTETYTVNPDCTGSSTKVTSSGITLHFDFVILHHGKEIRSIQTDTGVVVTLNSERLRRSED